MKPDVNDIVALVGLSLLGIGLFFLHPAAGFIVPGSILILAALWRVSK
jgi:hypothetical protein